MALTPLAAVEPGIAASRIAKLRQEILQLLGAVGPEV